MNKAYVNRYENGKSQTLHARDRANGVMYQSRMHEYLDELDAASGASPPVVITVPPAEVQSSQAQKSMAQMMLFDQPVRVKLAEPAAAHDPVAPVEARPAACAPPAMLRPAPRSAALSPFARSKPRQEFTLRGLLKGCGLGLATAAALLLAYLVVT